VTCSRLPAFALAATLCGAPPAAYAQVPQIPPDPAEVGRIQVGPLSLNPRFELLNIGVDSNVYNEAQGAREDFTATLRPSLDATLRFGRGRLTYKSWMDAVYFQKYRDERSINRFGEARLEVRLNRFVPFASVSGLSTRDRPNREIDLRARRETQSIATGAALQVMSRTSLIGSVRREEIRYNPGSIFRGEDLSRQLDETLDFVQGGVRLNLTPLTSLLVIGSAERQRFEWSPDRDSNTWRIAPTLEFDPSALISGSVMVGYRQFTPLHDALLPFRGVVAQASVRYLLLGRTRFDAQVTRDIEYSYEELLPYYLRTGGLLTVTQLLGGPLDIQGIVGRDRLAYRATPSIASEPAGVDTTDTRAGGIGYRLGQTARIGVNVEFTRRRARTPDRSYDRRRILGSITYGF
jgi:hypothetical protein